MTYSVPTGGVHFVCYRCFYQLLLENHVCCENSVRTVRLSVAWSVPTLTAVVTLVSDSSAFHSIRLHSTSFRSVLHSAYEILQTAFCSHLHLGSPLLRFFDHYLCWDRSSPSGSGSERSCLRSCLNLWPGAAAEDFMDGVPLSRNLFN